MAAKIRNRRLWTPEERRVLARLYPHHETRWVADQLGRTITQTNAQASLLGLKKSPEYLARLGKELGAKLQTSGKSHRFPKGHVPANKGLRRPGYASGRMRETQFKKGHSLNKMPLHSTRLVDGYLYIKVAEVPNVPYTVNWVPLHILEWERKNGPIPPKHCLWFKDGDKLNTELGNLELITRAENMRRNTLHRFPPEIVQAIQLRGAVMRQINKRSRREKQDQ